MVKENITQSMQGMVINKTLNTKLFILISFGAGENILEGTVVSFPIRCAWLDDRLLCWSPITSFLIRFSSAREIFVVVATPA
jgi:hypothetical protein